MSNITKILKYFILLIFLCLLIIIFLIILFTTKSIPDYNRIVTNSLVQAPVNVFRDKYAIPNIIGETNKDTFFALGYVHAQDRLWQMILLRRTAKGKLAEIFGEKYLETDKLMRTLDIYNNSKISIKFLSEKNLNLLKSYSNGINKRLLDIQKEGLGRGSPNLFLFPPKISPWTPTDSLAILKLYDLLNNESAKNEVIRLNLLNTGISYKRLSDIYPSIPDISNSKTLENKYLFSKEEKSENNKDNKSNITENIYKININASNASNIWAVLGSRSASGNTLVGYNLHSNFEIPIMWMIAKLELETGPVVGITIPGIPAIIVGRSKNLSWGISNSRVDNQDLVLETLNEKNNKEYKSSDGFKEFETRNILIQIKDKPGITYKILTSENGPIIPINSYGIKSINSDKFVVAIKWTGLDKKDRSMDSLIDLMMSENIEDAKKSLEHLVVPTLNFLLANQNKAELITAGKVPLRKKSTTSNYGVIPSIGSIEKEYWLGNLSYEDNSKKKISENGVIFNTNNEVLDQKFPKHHSYDWGNRQRFFRMQNIFEKRKYHTLESFKEIQTDVISSSARILLPLLAKNLWHSQVLDIENPKLSLRQEVIELLAEWNGEMSLYLSEPLIFYSWVAQFQKMIIQDEIGKNINWFNSINPDFLEKVLRDINGASDWCDIIQTDKIESCEEIALIALDNSLVINSKKYGKNIEQWQWGNFHKAHFSDIIIGQYPLISYLANIVFEVPGGDNTLSMSKSYNSLNSKHQSQYGSTLRVIMDLSNQNETYISIPTGQSGHFLSKNYDDFIELWQRNEYIKIPLRQSDIMKEKSNLMIISNSIN